MNRFLDLLDVVEVHILKEKYLNAPLSKTTYHVFVLKFVIILFRALFLTNSRKSWFRKDPFYANDKKKGPTIFEPLAIKSILNFG